MIGGENVASAIPGACKSPILHDPIPGVQFVFGGTSRITVSDTAHVELCGPSNGGEPPTTLYQQQSGSVAPTGTVGPTPAQTVDQIPSGGGSKVDPFTTVPTGVERYKVHSPQKVEAASRGSRPRPTKKPQST